MSKVRHQGPWDAREGSPSDRHADLRGVARVHEPHGTDAEHRAGTETLQHLRAVLDVGVQLRHPQATRGVQELRHQLRAEDLDALDRANAAKKALKNAETAVVANSEGRMSIQVLESLQDAGLASINGNEVLFDGKEPEREQIIKAERAKLQTALQAARLALDAAPRPEQSIRNAHKAMLPVLRERLRNLHEVLRWHGPLIARPIDQEAPRYGPTEGSHPPQFWTGPSGHDVLAQMATAVLDAIDGGEDVGILIHDEEWEKLRSDVQRESGELVRRAPPSGTALDAANVAHLDAQLTGARPSGSLSAGDREFEKPIELLRQQASTGRPLAAEVGTERERENQAGIPAAPPPAPPTSAAESESLQFNALERAIVLLVRDGGHPRSTRDYARDVGVSHTTLGRNESWQRAWKAAQDGAKKDKAEMPQGSKDAEGSFDAWHEEEVCENCRQEPMVASVVVNGEAVRLCETCQQKHALRTKPRTN